MNTPCGLCGQVGTHVCVQTSDSTVPLVDESLQVPTGPLVDDDGPNLSGYGSSGVHINQSFQDEVGIRTSNRGTKIGIHNLVLGHGYAACRVVEDFDDGHVVIVAEKTDYGIAVHNLNEPTLIQELADHRPVGTRMTLLPCTREQFDELARASTKDKDFQSLLASVVGHEIP